MLLLLALLLALFVSWAVWYRFLRWQGPVLPGPPGMVFFGVAFKVTTLAQRDILPLFKEWFDKYGSICEVEMIGTVYTLLSEPELVEPVLCSTAHITKGDWEYAFFRPWLRDGLLLSAGDKWRLRRKLLTPSFHFKILDSSLVAIGRHAEEFTKTLLETAGKPVAIQEIISTTTLKSICETAMGVRLNKEDKEQNEYIKAIKNASEGIVNRYLKFWLFLDCIYRNSQAGKIFYKSINTLQSFSKKVIMKRKKLFDESVKMRGDHTGGDKKKAFLDLLLEVEESNPGLFCEADIQEEVDTFMFEGHDTVAAALTFAHFLLANHPDVQEKAASEQDEIFGSDNRRPTMQDLNKMTYLEMVIKETLRLYPSVPFHSRKLIEDLRIDDKTVVPAGRSIGILTFFVHRSKRHWPDPERFDPERFQAGIERHPFAFIPFSGGPRNCIGQKLAMIEMKTILSTMLRSCRLEPITTEVVPVACVIIRSLDPIFVRVVPRQVRPATAHP